MALRKAIRLFVVESSHLDSLGHRILGPGIPDGLLSEASEIIDLRPPSGGRSVRTSVAVSLQINPHRGFRPIGLPMGWPEEESCLGMEVWSVPEPTWYYWFSIRDVLVLPSDLYGLVPAEPIQLGNPAGERIQIRSRGKVAVKAVVTEATSAGTDQGRVPVLFLSGANNSKPVVGDSVWRLRVEAAET